LRSERADALIASSRTSQQRNRRVKHGETDPLESPSVNTALDVSVKNARCARRADEPSPRAFASAYPDRFPFVFS
jgi:hypothetical protein